jgi:ketosteroid isomerase-like protein
MKGLLAVAFAMLALAPQVMAQNLTDEEQEVWSILETQLGHAYAGEWDASREYLHPDIVLWGPESEVPYPFTESGDALWQTFNTRSGTVLGFELTPVTVVVDGDVAIINFYVRYLLEATPGGDVEWLSWRGHNTWKKSGNRWLLLATYNTFSEDS